MFSRPKRKVLAIYLGFIIASLRNILAIIRAALVAIISSKHYDENAPSIRGRHKDRQLWLVWLSGRKSGFRVTYSEPFQWLHPRERRDIVGLVFRVLLR